MSNTQELVIREPAQVTLFGSDQPDEIILKATAISKVLKDVVDSQGLTKMIGGKPYVLVEGWTCLGSLVGVYSRTVWTRPLEIGGWEARVEAVTRDGSVISAAEASCTREETNWRTRDDFALRSMAQTRAMGKALRMPLGFIAVLAGYDATPAEEMIINEPDEPPAVTAKALIPGQIPVNFGKYKGQTIGEIASHDASYVKWLAEMSTNTEVKEAAGLFLDDEDIPF